MDELKLYTYIAVFGSFAIYFGIAWWPTRYGQAGSNMSLLLPLLIFRGKHSPAEEAEEDKDDEEEESPG